ncbi:MAG: dihydrodipicolinate synthase family protein [Chloroflexi bacterium]|nr:dihydrodipicolinate synthase family protein [Chloroflexota bacterium]
MSHALSGLFAPVLTPFRADLSVDVDRWIAFSKQLLIDGCHGLCPFGTTSEANSLALDERIATLTQLVEAGVPAAKLMPGTGASSIPEAVKLTKHAVKLGCAGVLLLPPFYYKGVSDEGIFRSIAEVIDRVAEDALQVYLYHIPPVAQVGFSLSLIERLLKAYPRTVVGLKDSSGDWNNQKAILTNFPGFGTFSGSEKFILDNLRLGGAGSINAVANVITAPLRKLFDNWQTPQAEQYQEDVMVIAKARGDYPAIPFLKQIVAYAQQDPTWLTVRPPLVQLTDTQAEGVITKLTQAKFF